MLVQPLLKTGIIVGLDQALLKAGAMQLLLDQPLLEA
jgi:hypothetical protein